MAQKKIGAVAALVALAGTLLVGLEPPRAEAQPTPPEPVLSSGAGEFQPVPADDLLSWQQNSKKRPNRFNVFAMRDGDPKFKVNAKKTNAANGGIDGNTLVYQQYKGGNSQLKFFDLLERTRSKPPKGVNTKQWEYWPSISGKWLLFGRLKDNGDRMVILFDITTGDSVQLDKTTSKNGFLAPGQVNGNYAVWYKCPPSENCDVYRYNIPGESKFKIPSTDHTHHAPSVTRQGTVYFARKECGDPVRLMRFPLGGPATELARLPRGGDVASTRVFVNGNGAVELFYEHNVCKNPTGSDIWKISEPTMFELSVTKQGGGNGTVTSSPGGIDCGSNCLATYEEGTSVTLTAASQGQSSFKSWGGSCSGTQNTCTLTMDEAKDVIANFDPPPNLANLAVTKTGPGSGTVTSSPAGINCGTDCSENYPVGTSVTLTAAAAAKSTFTGWTGACTGSNTTCTVTMDSGKTATANFTTVTHTLTVSKTGNGSGTVTSSPSGINCGTDCTENFAVDSSVTLTAAATTGSTFTGWTGACTGNNSVCTVTMNAAKSATASFTQINQTLTVAVTGNGTVTSTNPAGGINCPGDCTEPYNFGTVVELTAAGLGSDVFVGWGGACSGTATTCNVTMNQARSVTATFTHTLNVTVTGDGTVTSTDPAEINCPGDCTHTYSPGTMVTLTANPTAPDVFVEWGGACSGTATTCDVTMNQARSVTATFTHTLTVDTAGDGSGTVESADPAQISCTGTAGAESGDCSEQYRAGNAVTLTATPASNSTVTWNGCDTTPTAETCSVTMNTDKPVTATFTLITLTVEMLGDGSGAVTSNDGMINCTGTAGAEGGDCNETYNQGTMVTLTADPDEPVSQFAGWGGACSGTQLTCEVTMNAAKTVTATFNLAGPSPRTLTVSTAGDGPGWVTGTGIDCGQTGLGTPDPAHSDCTQQYSDGTVVNLTENLGSGSTFTGWTGTGAGTCLGTTSPCPVTMDADKDVTATFDDPLVIQRRRVTGPALILGYPTVPTRDAVRSRTVHDSWWYLFSG